MSDSEVGEPAHECRARAAAVTVVAGAAFFLAAGVAIDVWRAIVGHSQVSLSSAALIVGDAAAQSGVAWYALVLGRGVHCVQTGE